MAAVAPILNRKIRAAIVGCGRIAQSHWDAMAQYPDDIVCVAACDPVEAARHQWESSCGTAVYADLEGLLQTEKPDLLILCTPSGLHAQQTALAARYGAHVLSEKPMATDWQDGQAMVQACREAGVHLWVVKQNRYNDTLQALHRAVVGERFGAIHLVSVNVFWTRPQSYYDQGAWRGTWQMDGGALMNQASHYVDLLHWLVGPVATIHAMSSTTRAIETEDTAVLNLRWQNGALGSMSVTMLTYPQNLEGSITILGERGTARVGGVALNEIQLWQFADVHEGDTDIHAANYSPDSVYGSGHTRYYQDMIAALRGQSAPVIDGVEGLKSLELLIAAYTSARLGHTVSLPLEPNLPLHY